MTYAIRKSLHWLVITIILLSLVSSNAYSYEENNRIGAQEGKFKQELKIPIDTSIDESKFQPIDIHIDFDNDCWAQNENIHSIRVFYELNSDIIELESQVYDLQYTDNSHISSCNLVFLIPEIANGQEKYYLYYDSDETSAPNYKDHISIEDLHYYYEPVSGAKADINYYKIKEDGLIVYAISYKGELFGQGISQVVARLKPDAVEFGTTKIDQLASFTMLYSIDGEPPLDYTGTSWAKNPSKSILIDGNLMIKIRIISISPEGNIKTDNIYTYYYCPIETKRMHVNVNHEVLNNIEIKGSRNTDGTIANLVTFKGRSATVENINVGDILPGLHLYSEDDKIKQFYVPPDPDSAIEEVILTRKDDVDLGHKAWLCIDDSSTGKTHGILFGSNEGLMDGEEDGIQVKALIQQPIKLPGLEIDAGQIYATINSYEKGGIDNWVLPKGMNISFESEFITFQNGGYEAVDKESEIYQLLAKNKPNIIQKKSTEDKDIEYYNLNAKIHFASSFPFGSLCSILIGKNFSYISAELYKDNNLFSSACVNRLPLCDDISLDFEGKSLLQKIKLAFGLIDLKNFSFFKKICFPNLEAGQYVIRIYKENPFFSNERQYIGYSIIDLDKDSSIHIYCRPQGTIKLKAIDQNNNGVKNVRCLLEKDGTILIDGFSNEKGLVNISAPCYPTKPYIYKIIYQGFLIEEKEIKIGLVNRLIPIKESVIIKQHKLDLEVIDTWGFTSDVDTDPILTSDKMIEPLSISSVKKDNDEYEFMGLYPSDYTLNIGYKSFDIEQDIKIDKDVKLKIEFPAEYKVNINVLNSYGNQLTAGIVEISRNGKTEKKEIKNNGQVSFLVPPGDYEIIISIDDEKIAKQKIIVRNEKNIDIVTIQDSLLHILITYIGIILGIFSFIIIFWKKKINDGLKLLIIALIIISLFSSWTFITGDDGVTKIDANTYLIPSNIVSITSSTDVFGGEISYVPEEVTMAFNFLSILLVVCLLLVSLSLLIKNKMKKINLLFLILCLVILIVSLFVFHFVMSELAKVSLGSVIGSGEIEVSLPGIAESKNIMCNWGPGIGFYLILSALFIFLIIFLKKRFKY